MKPLVAKLPKVEFLTHVFFSQVPAHGFQHMGKICGVKLALGKAPALKMKCVWACVLIVVLICQTSGDHFICHVLLLSMFRSAVAVAVG